jgi:tetraacyldisaccharide 4'-kinase
LGGLRARAPVRIEDRLARRGGAVELLRVPAALFGALARLRGALYDRRWLPVLAVDTPVISVGNVVAGGTGKTPFVAWLCGRLVARGLRPGILSRGYRPRTHVTHTSAHGAMPNDEARMLAELLPDVPHVQDRDRVRGAGALEARGVDVIVLDDGFQHRRLARDLDLVLVDATRPWGLAVPEGSDGAPVEALLPRGLLREPQRALGRAHALVLTRCEARPPAALAALEAELAALAPGVPLARAIQRPVRLRRLLGGEDRHEARPLTWLAGRAVDLVSGVGNPAAFERTVEDLGATVALHRRFPDHHPFTPADFAGLGARPVLLTAKDAARTHEAPAPLWPAELSGCEVLALDIELQVTAGGEALERLLDELPEAPARRARTNMHGGLHG